MALTKTISGARAIFTIDSKPMAYANGVDFAEEVAYEPVEVLNHLAVKEWVPTAYRVSLSANMFRTIGTGTGEGSLKQQGFFPEESQILGFDDMSTLLADRGTRKVIAKVDGVKTASYNLSITARGIVGMGVQFVCIRARDENSLP